MVWLQWSAAKKLIMIFAILSIILISGCIQQQIQTDENNGLVIGNFYANPQDVDEDKTVYVYMEVQTVGQTTATDVKTELLGVSDVWYGYNGAKSMGEMKPPTEYRKGDLKVSQWTLAPPDLPEGIVQTFPITARATYDYATNSFVIIKTINEDQYKIIINNEEELPDSLITSNTDGPMKVELEQGPAPIVVDPSDTEVKIPVRFKFSNTGGGWPITNDNVGSFHIDVKVAGSGAKFVDCEGMTDDNTASSLWRILREDKTSPLSCTIQIDKELFRQRVQDIVTFSFTLTYTYYVETQTSVVVHGKQGTPSRPPDGGTASVCGNQVCESPTETASTCPGDCHTGSGTQTQIPFVLDSCSSACRTVGMGTPGTCKKAGANQGTCFMAGGNADTLCMQAAASKSYDGTWHCCCASLPDSIDPTSGECYTGCHDTGGLSPEGYRIYYDSARCYKAGVTTTGNPLSAGNSQCEGFLGDGAKCYCLGIHKACDVGSDGRYYACVGRADASCADKQSYDPSNNDACDRLFGQGAYAADGDYACKKSGMGTICCCKA